MRYAALLVMVLLFPASGRAQEVVRSDAAPHVRIAAARAEPNSATAIGAPSGSVDEFDAKLQTLAARFRDDPRLQRGAFAVALFAAVGAVRGRRSLTGVGTQALRLGLDKPLATMRERTGFTVAPTLGYRTLAVTVTRTFR